MKASFCWVIHFLLDERYGSDVSVYLLCMKWYDVDKITGSQVIQVLTSDLQRLLIG